MNTAPYPDCPSCHGTDIATRTVQRRERDRGFVQIVQESVTGFCVTCMDRRFDERNRQAAEALKIPRRPYWYQAMGIDEPHPAYLTTKQRIGLESKERAGREFDLPEDYGRLKEHE